MTSTELKHQAQLAKWTELIKECRSSGLPVKTWFQQAQITPSTYYRWERNVLASTETNRHSEKTAFAEVPVPKTVNRNVSAPSATLRIGCRKKIYPYVLEEISPLPYSANIAMISFTMRSVRVLMISTVHSFLSQTSSFRLSPLR